MLLRQELDVLAQDLRYNARVIRRAGPLSIAVVLTLSVGLGINAIVFSLFNSLLFRPWATHDPDSFVHVYARPSGWRPAADGPGTMVTLEDFNRVRSDTRTLAAVTVERWASFRLGEGDGTSLRGALVSCNFLSAHLGPMRLGRGLLESDCSTSGLEPVVVLTERSWERYLAADPNIIGRRLRLNDHLLTVVGVAPDDATGGPIAAMLYVPYTMQPVLQGPTDYFREPPGSRAWLRLSGRLAPGHTISEARAELAVIARSLDRLHPGRATDLLVTDGAIIHEPDTARTMPLLLALCLCTTVLILLLVCANVTTLLLARALARRQEMAVRLALGGSRSRLLRQLLTETIALAGCAACGGIALAYYVPQYAAERLALFPLLNGFTPDWRVFAFTLGLALVAGCLAGVSPAIETLRFNILPALKGTGNGGGPTVSPRLRGTLIANQLSISLALLIVIGVVVRTQDRLVHTTLDYDANATIVTTVDLSHVGYQGPSARAFYDRLMPSLQALPSVRAVGLASPPPFRGMPRTSFSLETAPGRTLRAAFRCVTPEYFPLTALRVLSGRLFSDLQARTPARVMPIVVSDSFARTFFRGVDAVGGRIRFGNGDLAQIIAVVRDTSSLRPTEPDEPMIYQPIYSAELASLATVLRVDGDPRPVMQAIRAEVLRLDPRLSARPETIATIIAGDASRYDAVIGLIAVPAMLALFLSVIGIYGLTSFAAAQRTHEIGVRVALGASRRDIVVLFFWSLRWPFLFGVVGGCVCAVIGVAVLRSTRVLATTSSLEVSAYGLSIVVLLFTAGVATLLPAIRAARSEPWSTLRAH